MDQQFTKSLVDITLLHIPFELKLIIFEYVGTFGKINIKNISEVCEQFDEIVKYHPKLWFINNNKLNNKYTNNQLLERLFKDKRIGNLKIDLSGNYHTP